MENIYSNKKPRRKDGNYKVIWYVKIRALSILKIRVLTPPDCFSPPPPAQTADNDGDIRSCWWPRLDTSFLATLCRHKTNKRNPITEKEANEDAISITLSQPNYVIIWRLSFSSPPFPLPPQWALSSHSLMSRLESTSSDSESIYALGGFIWFDTSVENWRRGHAAHLGVKTMVLSPIAFINRNSSHSCHLFIVDITSNRGIEHY